MQHFILPMTGLHESNLMISCLLRCFAIIINRFLARTRNIVHFGVTLNMLFTYLHTMFCIYMYIQLYTVIHTYIHIQHTYMPIYRHTHMHTYFYMHTHKYIHICTYLHVYLFTYVGLYIPLLRRPTSKHKYIYNTYT